MSRFPLLRNHYEQGWRLSVQRRSQPIQWEPGQREALIQQAIDEGRIQACPPAYAEGILTFNVGFTVHPSFSSRKSGAA